MTAVAGFELLRDSLNLAVPLRIMELRDRPTAELQTIARSAASQFTNADVMMYKPNKKPGQIKHVITMLAVLAILADGGIEFAGTKWDA